jgi:hypothetical protein
MNVWLVVLSLVSDAILLMVFALVIGVALYMHGLPTLMASPSRCPACGDEALEVVQTGAGSVRLPVLGCSACGAGYRKELDGTLTKL